MKVYDYTISKNIVIDFSFHYNLNGVLLKKYKRLSPLLAAPSWGAASSGGGQSRTGYEWAWLTNKCALGLFAPG